MWKENLDLKSTVDSEYKGSGKKWIMDSKYPCEWFVEQMILKGVKLK